MPLVFHFGDMASKRLQLAQVEPPQPTTRWAPLHHLMLLERVEQGLEECGLEIVDEAHELGSDGQRYFGLLEIRRGDSKRTSSWVVGLRNSYDQPFGASVFAGARVLVSDNLIFSGDVGLEHDHTPNFYERLRERMPGVIRLLNKFWLRQDHRISLYRSYGMHDVAAHDLVIRAVDAEVCPNELIPSVLEHWRVPLNEEFQARTAWSLFNGFIEALKDTPFVELTDKIERLHHLFDARVGIKTYPKGEDGS